LAVVDRDRVAPEDLSGYAPILDLLHPPEEGPVPSLGMDTYLAAPDRVDHRGRERGHADEPLGREARLDHGVRPFGPGHGMPVPGPADYEALPFETRGRLLARFVPVEPPELGGNPLSHEARLLVEDLGGRRQPRIPHRDLSVDRIVSRGDLEGARA